MDARMERSRSSILDAMTRLVKANALTGLSITQVAKAAGVTRPTFYQHFTDVPAAARAAAFVLLEEAFPFAEPYVDGAVPTAAEIDARIHRQALPLLTFLADHRAFFVRVMEEAGTAGFFDDLVSFTSARLLPEMLAPPGMDDEGRAIMARFFAGGLSWMAINWLRAEPLRPPKALARDISAVMVSLTAVPGT